MKGLVLQLHPLCKWWRVRDGCRLRSLPATASGAVQVSNRHYGSLVLHQRDQLRSITHFQDSRASQAHHPQHSNVHLDNTACRQHFKYSAPISIAQKQSQQHRGLDCSRGRNLGCTCYARPHYSLCSPHIFAPSPLDLRLVCLMSPSFRR
jgi:hypothetical protein